MKVFDLMKKLKACLDVFKKQPEAKKGGKKKLIALLIGIVAAVAAVAVGAIVLLKKIKKRRLEKEAEEALEEHLSTDPDADEFSDDEEPEEE